MFLPDHATAGILRCNQRWPPEKRTGLTQETVELFGYFGGPATVCIFHILFNYLVSFSVQINLVDVVVVVLVRAQNLDGSIQRQAP